MDAISLAMTFKENGEELLKMIEAWKYFNETEVIVGITEESNSDRGSVNNAELLYLHECGVPSHNIPPRPVLKPAIAQPEVAESIKTMMSEGMKAALVHGDKEACGQYYERAGMLGRDACKDYIAGGVPPPNAPSTIRRKGSSLPLVDTGSMMNSITYAVRKKK